ncbi:hypothetical protein SAMN05421693_11378 [Ectothiorhodospira magna]|uniref:Uncharacterized protein n=1 Tax=Ectothiorhodospira magna TaxID=867345 RepID=A0A1H9CF88_9GAMM|nr:hypothetical protein SAMN05421693_11378 [Ectothiorhodospira magna]
MTDYDSYYSERAFWAKVGNVPAGCGLLHSNRSNQTVIPYLISRAYCPSLLHSCPEGETHHVYTAVMAGQGLTTVGRPVRAGSVTG